MSASLRASTDGLSAYLQVGGVDVAAFGAARDGTVAAGTTFTASTALGKIIECITNNAQAHVLPLGSTMPVGGEVIFISKTIGNTVAPQGGNVITGGNAAFTSVPLNPGTVLRFTWDGAEWKLNIIPSAGFLHNYTGGDIALNVGEQCYYDIAAVTSLLLRVATATDQEYEVSFGSSGVLTTSSNTWALRLNNTTYGSTISVGQFAANITTNAGANATSSRGDLPIQAVTAGFTYGFTARVKTKTAGKQLWAEARSSQASAGFMSIMHSISTDTTTVWSSLGTLDFGGDTVTGRILVRRIA